MAACFAVAAAHGKPPHVLETAPIDLLLVGETDPFQCVLSGRGASVAVAGDPAEVRVTACNVSGLRRKRGGDRIELAARSVEAEDGAAAAQSDAQKDGGEEEGAPSAAADATPAHLQPRYVPLETAPIIDGANGMYKAPYTAPIEVGLYTIGVTVNGIEAPSKPLAVVPNMAEPMQTEVRHTPRAAPSHNPLHTAPRTQPLAHNPLHTAPRTQPLAHSPSHTTPCTQPLAHSHPTL